MRTSRGRSRTHRVSSPESWRSPRRDGRSWTAASTTALVRRSSWWLTWKEGENGSAGSVDPALTSGDLLAAGFDGEPRHVNVEIVVHADADVPAQVRELLSRERLNLDTVHEETHRVSRNFDRE